jgi:hypothetical protein
MTTVLLGPAAASVPSVLTPSQVMMRKPPLCGAAVVFFTPPIAASKLASALAGAGAIAGVAACDDAGADGLDGIAGR